MSFSMHRATLLTVSNVVSLMLGVAIGAVVAVYIVERANAPIEEMGAIQRMSAYVSSQRELGSPASYEAALTDYLAALERRRAAGAAFSDARIIETDIVLAHARLAILFEKQGNIEASAKQMQAALSRCPTAYLKPCAADALREVVLRLDRPRAVVNEK
jgi:hypothetical protein